MTPISLIIFNMLCITKISIEKNLLISWYLLQNLRCWRVVRVVEGARLESVYTSKGYRGFESLTLRKKNNV
jgi:hypothetical protein